MHTFLVPPANEMRQIARDSHWSRASWGEFNNCTTTIFTLPKSGIESQMNNRKEDVRLVRCL